ncbi:endolytic transglycosylase MltG [Candidatus Saccharibacteria bacterium]|nr:endolytic transglycosylase MltG [Candidatus Saccharibacteria bacterium]
MRVIGLDIGEKRIGVAKADSSTRIAVPIGFINVDGSEWQRIARIANLQGTNLFVLGLPRSNEGSETQQSLYVRNFAKELIRQIPEAKVRFQDESLTSVEAEERLKSRKRNYEKGEIDAEAATIILQDFMEGLVDMGTSKPLAEEVSTSVEGSTGVVAGVAAGVKAAATEVKDNATIIAKKQSDKVKLNTKKAKHKMKTATKWVSGIAIIVILALIGVGVALLVKEQRHQEYLAWVAEQEAQMQAEVFNFTIRPGETIYDIKQSLIELGYSATEVDQAFNASYDFEFLRERPQGATLEGYLYGETYEFYEGTAVKDILTKYLKKMGEVISENSLEASYAAQGLSLYEGITLASVVQKESKAADMPTVAQVFLTRLGYGMLLGSDVTVSYALDTIDPNRQIYGDNYSALDVDSCYNTRRYAGLPCGPISNPGLAALLAVANPSDTSYLYFLTGDDGLMYYSYTEDEHLRNASLYCQSLCQVSL